MSTLTRVNSMCMCSLLFSMNLMIQCHILYGLFKTTHCKPKRVQTFDSQLHKVVNKPGYVRLCEDLRVWQL